MQAKNVMTTKVVSIAPMESLRTAALMMQANNVSGLPVVSGDGELIGMITEGDLLRRIALDPAHRSRDDVEHIDPQSLGDFSRSTRRSVQDTMTRTVVCISPETEVAEIAQMLLSHKIKRVLVMHLGRIIGVVSRCDLMAAIIEAPHEGIRREDEALLESIRTRLKNELNLDPGMINIVVSNAQAYVYGRLVSSAQRNAIRSLVGSVPGIDALIDETTLSE